MPRSRFVAAVLVLLLLTLLVALRRSGAPESTAPSADQRRAADAAEDAAATGVDEPARRERRHVDPAEPRIDQDERAEDEEARTPPPASDARRLVVHVVSAEGARPLPGARVSGQWGGAADAVAGDDGVACVADPPTGVVFVMASAAGHVRSRWVAADTRGTTLAPVTVTLEPGLALEGEVVDAVDGRPVVGAALDLRDGAGSAIFGDPPLATAATDARGRFRLDGVVREGTVTLLVRADGCAARRVELRVPRDVREAVRIELTRAGTLRGHVVSADGAGAARATVRVVPADRADWIDAARSSGDFVGGSPPWLETRTDESGAFAVAGLTFEHVWVALARSRTSGVTPLSARLDPQALPDDLVLTLPASARVAIRVLDGAGAPVAGAVVRLGTARVRRRSAVQDAAGRFVLDDLPAGAQEVRVEAPGYLARQLAFDVPAGEGTELVVDLDRGATVAGVVTDAGGAPVAGADVVVRDEDGEQRTTTDASGVFATSGVVAGDVRISAASAAFAATTVRATAPAAALRIVVARLATLTWRVRLPAGTRDASGNVLHQVFRGKGDADPVTGVEGWSRRIGKLEFVDGVATVTWTASGPSRAVVYTREFAPAFAFADPEPGAVLDLGEVVLSPGRAIRGRVQDDARRPVADARVVIRERPTSKHVDLRTAADGTFELTGLSDGPVPFTVSAAGHGGADVVVPASHDGSPLVVTLVRLRRIAVRVLDVHGAPLPDAAVEIHRVADGEEHEAYGFATDAEGTGALVAEVPPGRYRLRADGAPPVDVDATGPDDPAPVVLRLR